jgi:AraC-like DNA-binding protein
MHAECRQTTVPFQAKPIALMRVAGLTPFVAFAARSGPSIDGLLVRANLPAHVLEYPESVIPVAQVLGFMEDVAATRGMEQLGLRAGGEAAIDALGMFGRVIGGSATLDEALATLVRIAPSFDSGGRWWTVRRHERTWLCHQLTAAACSPYRQADQYWLAIALNLLRSVAGRGWRPDEVRLQTSETRALRQADVLAGTPVFFAEAETAIGFPTTLLSRPLPRRSTVAKPPDLRDVERWQASAPAGDYLQSVQQVIATLSSPDYPRIDVVARAIGTGVRTLQRRLADAGTSYERMLARARFGTAAHLLASTDATVLDIALDVGYSDHAHFTRAFRRWTGVPPREFRKHGRAHGLPRRP